MFFGGHPGAGSISRWIRFALWSLLATSFVAAAPVLADGDPGAKSDASGSKATRSTGEAILLYLPNRVFDLLDLVRLRVRIGPGIAASARVTEAVDASLGAYNSIFVGLPGPRSHPRVNLPLGVENYTGIELSVAGGEAEDEPEGPNYGALEIGVGVQAALVGIDFGIDPGELLDLALGLICVDVIGDDL